MHVIVDAYFVIPWYNSCKNASGGWNIHACTDTQLTWMPRDVPPLDGMRDTNLMAKLCSSSGEGMFGWCQDEILDLALSSSTEGRYRERSLHTKRTVWEPTGTEWAELACLRELCLSYEWVKFHLLCALIVPFAVAEGEENIDMAEEENVLKWQRWIGNLRKEYKGQKRKEKRMRHEMAGRTNRGRISRVWNCKNMFTLSQHYNFWFKVK